MSVTQIMGTGLAALNANQTALRITSNNVANVNTEGYVRQEARMESTVLGTQGAGVNTSVVRAVDSFLAAAHQSSISNAGQFEALSGLLDRAQAALGDPSNGGSVFSGVDELTSSLASLALSPSSSLRQANTAASIEATFEDIRSAYRSIDQLRADADNQLRSTVTEANSLLAQVAELNKQIQISKISGSDTGGSETQQGRILDRLTEMMDIRVTQREQGGVELRTQSGISLVDQTSARLALDDSTNEARFSEIVIFPPGSDGSVGFAEQVRSGEIRGLLTARDKELPEITYALSEYASGLATALNKAHNEGTSVPAPLSLTGRNTGLVGTDSLNFTGEAQLAVLDSDGRRVQTIDIDFDAGTLTVGGAPTAFAGTIDGFTSALNTALGGSGSASFTNGVLEISATGTNGIAIAQSDTDPSDRAGSGFSAFFGLNDIVKTQAPISYDTGLQGTDTHNITGSITLALRNESGDLVRTIDYTPTAGTVNDLVSELNSASVFGGSATASLDSNGRLTLVPNSAVGIGSIDTFQDLTNRGGTSVSMSQLFGLGTETPSSRAQSFQISADIQSNPSRLATSRLDVSITGVGSLALASGENGGVLALQNSLSSSITLHNLKGQAATTLDLGDAAAQIASQAGQSAAISERQMLAAVSTREEAALRRSSSEGVNLDEEMVRMTVYQQSYNAASRLIRAAQEMYDTILNMV